MDLDLNCLGTVASKKKPLYLEKSLFLYMTILKILTFKTFSNLFSNSHKLYYIKQFLNS